MLLSMMLPRSNIAHLRATKPLRTSSIKLIAGVHAGFGGNDSSCGLGRCCAERRVNMKLNEIHISILRLWYLYGFSWFWFRSSCHRCDGFNIRTRIGRI